MTEEAWHVVLWAIALLTGAYAFTIGFVWLQRISRRQLHRRSLVQSRCSACQYQLPTAEGDRLCTECGHQVLASDVQAAVEFTEHSKEFGERVGAAFIFGFGLMIIVLCTLLLGVGEVLGSTVRTALFFVMFPCAYAIPTRHDWVIRDQAKT